MRLSAVARSLKISYNQRCVTSRDLSSMIIVPNRFVRERLSRLGSALYKKVVKSQNGFIISSHSNRNENKYCN